ncbi:conserved exported protein of unknown function [Georgfuchsia toluolica]|uniref:Uncharacterized protein n=1 Tax=Georgfuchsia toluolica TaxID=424218 RepID=A0A916J4F6_9PROT|nr:hypothetical protein [Georgfuchsia toluolica]CAG4883786.1 conserved exported protein of unknown function [Georgfuchsia toluolica]
MKMKNILTATALLAGFSLSGAAFAAACDGTGGAQTAGSAAPTAGAETCVCNGGTAIKSTVNGGSGAIVTTPVFIRTGFDVQCSANTLVSYNEVSTNAFATAGGSVKGNQSFIGSSNGGSVATDQKCTGTNSACTGSDITGALGRAVTAASGS